MQFKAEEPAGTLSSLRQPTQLLLKATGQICLFYLFIYLRGTVYINEHFTK